MKTLQDVARRLRELEQDKRHSPARRADFAAMAKILEGAAGTSGQAPSSGQCGGGSGCSCRTAVPQGGPAAPGKGRSPLEILGEAAAREEEAEQRAALIEKHHGPGFRLQ
jgi:hypothetical protein